MTLDPAYISNFLIFLSGFSIVFLVLLWISLIIWTYRDIRSRTKDSFLRIVSVLISTVLFVPGIFIYLLLRPNKTLDEAYQISLEEEALLQTLEEFTACPVCDRQIAEDWMICPDCHTLLKKKCAGCGRTILMTWDICPFCEEIQPGNKKDEFGTTPLIPVSEQLIDD